VYDDNSQRNTEIIDHYELFVYYEKENGQNTGQANRIENFINVPYPGMPYDTFVRFGKQKRSYGYYSNYGKLGKKFIAFKIEGQIKANDIG
jgi:hypothetical protein